MADCAVYRLADDVLIAQGGLLVMNGLRRVASLGFEIRQSTECFSEPRCVPLVFENGAALQQQLPRLREAAQFEQ